MARRKNSKYTSQEQIPFTQLAMIRVAQAARQYGLNDSELYKVADYSGRLALRDGVDQINTIHQNLGLGMVLAERNWEVTPSK